MRTGKPAIDLIKALDAGMLPPPRPAQASTHGAGALTVAELLHRADLDQSLRAILQTGQRQPEENMAGTSTPPASDPAGFPVPTQDLEPGPPASSSPFPVMPGAQNNNMGMPPGQGPSLSPPHHPIDVTNIEDYLSTAAGDPALPGAESQLNGFALPVLLAMDFDYLSQFDLSESDPQVSENATPSGSSDGANDGAMLVDPALQQPSDALCGHSCVRTAKELQQSIVAIASRGEERQSGYGAMASTLPDTTTDQALLTCSNIGKQLLEMLRCRCEADAYLPFLTTVIISKLLAVYGAIAKVDDSTPFSFASSAKVQREQDHGNDQEAFVAVPLRLGTYDVDGELERVFRAQLVSFELSKLECMAQLFEEKYCCGGGAVKPSEHTAIYSALAQFIKDRYARTKAACKLRSTLQTPGMSQPQEAADSGC